MVKETRKEKALREAREQGIVDVDVISTKGSSNSLEALELAIELTKKHGLALCKEFEERRKI